MGREELLLFLESMNMSVTPINQEITDVQTTNTVPVVNQDAETILDNNDVVMNTNDIDSNTNTGGDDESIITSFCDITGSDRESGRHFLEVSLFQ
jgi:hypothetical protein